MSVALTRSCAPIAHISYYWNSAGANDDDDDGDDYNSSRCGVLGRRGLYVSSLFFHFIGYTNL